MIAQTRYGQPACDCGHVWGIHDVYEYPGDGTEMCCVHGCDQTGCPGWRDKHPGLAGETGTPTDAPAQPTQERPLS